MLPPPAFPQTSFITLFIEQREIKREKEKEIERERERGQEECV